MMVKNSLILLALMGFSATAFAQEKDIIRLKKDSKPKEVTIAEETFKGVATTITGGGKTVYLWKDIESVEYQGRPKELTQAIGMVKKGDFEDALPLLKKMRDAQNLRPVFRQQALFYYAQAAEAKGTPADLQTAVDTYRDLLKEFKQSRYLNKAYDGIVRGLIAAGKYDEARKAVISSRQEAMDAKLDEELIRDLDLLECTLLESEEKYADAATAYDKLAAAASSNPELADLARIGSARCQLEKGDASRSKVVFEEVINKSNENTSPVVLAAAWNGVGRIQLAEGRKESKADKVQEALYSFLRGVVLYFPSENDRTTEYERSLYYSAQAFDALAKLTTDDNQKKANQARASEKMKELKDKYPLSALLKKK